MPRSTDLFNRTGQRALLVHVAPARGRTEHGALVNTVTTHTNVIILQERAQKNLTTGVTVTGQLYRGHTRGIQAADVSLSKEIVAHSSVYSIQQPKPNLSVFTLLLLLIWV